MILRSELLQVLLVFGFVSAQNYEYDGGDSPDYSKYYSVDSTPTINQPQKSESSASDFVSPIEFSSFFTPSNYEFGASNAQTVSKPAKQVAEGYEQRSGFPDFKSQHPFASKDYFEEAQKQKNSDNDEDEVVKPGPSYVSHKTVAPISNNYASEIGDLSKDQESVQKYNQYVPKYQNVKQVTIEPKYQNAKHTAIDPKYLPQAQTYPNPTPYQKYSFQPVSSNADYKAYTPKENYKATVTPTFKPYDIAASDQVAKLLKQKSCRKVFKEVVKNDKIAPMDCYVCKDDLGANYESCSYTSETNPKNYYVESSRKSTKPTSEKIENYRYKRYTPKDDDPYEYVKEQSQKYYSKPKDFDEYYKPEEYRFPAAYFKENEEKSSSEKESEALVKTGENCKKVAKDNMLCMVCVNSKTGGNYEQCAYSSEPNEKKYAYVKERNYDKEDEPEETQVTEDKATEEVKPVTTHRSDEQAKDTKTVEDYAVPTHFQEQNKDKEDYYSKFFPDYSKEESKTNEKQAEFAYYGEGEKKDVEEVLAEFAKKDRSNCKKAEKKGMTCYLCTDKKGMQHEECMYVSESKPQSKYSAYHAEAKEPKEEVEESKIAATEVPLPKSKTTSLKKVESKSTTTTTTTAATPTTKKTRQFKRTKNVPNNVAAASTVEVQTALPDPYIAEGEDGAFTAETRPVFSKTLGFSLPKFMLAKSEGELIYDEFVHGKS
ncbi:PREDICTED: uncharacterized protein LOC108566660 [Nicrophorus vespilloides]|uniref:Uncharacterized protein LOC108566660 n=1 Tax=Nicrophorus vespilloides TaxID=110193 RepID=A0ABM1N5N3_NICVS|nr:PREDICTED: uncharacterized protein LOC108566660 [Nicrophorus vespilloides]